MSFILLVEPDATSAAAIQQALAADGLEVKAVGDPDAALQVAAAQAPRLIIVSSEVPRAERLLESFARSKGGPGSVAVMAADSDPTHQPSALQADETILRPFSDSDLRSAVERCWSAERGEGSGAPKAEKRSLSSEDIFGDVLAELSVEADLEGDSTAIDRPASPSGKPRAADRTRSPSAAQDLGGEVDALLAGTLADLDLGPSVTRSATGRPRTAPSPVSVEPDLPVESDPPAAAVKKSRKQKKAAVKAVAAPVASVVEPAAEPAIESAPEAAIESVPEAAIETASGPSTAIAIESEEEPVEVLEPLGDGEADEAESRSRAVLIGAIAGTAIIGLLLVVLLNFVGGGDPVPGQASEAPQGQRFEPPADELPIIGEVPTGEEVVPSAAAETEIAVQGNGPDVAESASASAPAAEEASRQPEELSQANPVEQPAASEAEAGAADVGLSTGADPQVAPLSDELEDRSAAADAEPLTTDSLGLEVLDDEQTDVIDDEIEENLASAPTDNDLPEASTPFDTPDAAIESPRSETESRPTIPPAEGPAAAQIVRTEEVVTPAPAASDRSEIHEDAAAEPPAAASPIVPGTVVDSGPGVVPPQLNRQSFQSPAYPAIARRMNRQGTVEVSVLVDETGVVTDVKLVKGVLKKFDEDVLQAVRKATFSPATKNGIPVSMWRTLKFEMRPNN